MKTYAGVEVQLHVLLTSALDGGQWSTSRPGCFTPGERSPDVRLDMRLGGPQGRYDRDGKDKKQISVPTGNRTTVVQSVDQWLYWLSYCGQQFLLP
jgi:hypothetical protein